MPPSAHRILCTGEVYAGRRNREKVVSLKRASRLPNGGGRLTDRPYPHGSSVAPRSPLLFPVGGSFAGSSGGSILAMARSKTRTRLLQEASRSPAISRSLDFSGATPAA